MGMNGEASGQLVSFSLDTKALGYRCGKGWQQIKSLLPFCVK